MLTIKIPRKVLKGGSHLCAPNYCRRYRPAARMAQPIILEPDMKIMIDDAEVRVSRWEYHFKPADQTFELRIFLRGKWAAVAPPATLNVDPQAA